MKVSGSTFYDSELLPALKNYIALINAGPYVAQIVHVSSTLTDFRIGRLRERLSLPVEPSSVIESPWAFAISFEHRARFGSGWLHGWTLTEEDCHARRSHWMQQDGERREITNMAIDEEDPNECRGCGSSDLAWNGLRWWCNNCGSRVDRIAVYRRIIGNFYNYSGVNDRVPVAPFNDHWYAETTALYRVPASLNWPHGRIRPRVRYISDGKPRRRWAKRAPKSSAGL